MPRRLAILLILVCTALNVAGFAFNLFEPVFLYDEIAHFLTPFTLVAITSEMIYRAGGNQDFFSTPRHAFITGAVIGLVGAIGWEIIELVVDMLFPEWHIYRPLPDTVLDVILGAVAGSIGSWRVDSYLDHHITSRQP